MALSTAQLRMRRTGITATDLSAILGENPWRKPIDVWMDKMGYTPLVKIQDERASIGHAFEAAVAMHYKRTQCPKGKRWRIWQPTTTIRHQQAHWALATPDRYVFEADEFEAFPQNKEALSPHRRAHHLAEIKLVGPRVLHHWLLDPDNPEVRVEADRVPPYVYCQVQWQLFVTGYTRCDVVALLGSTTFRVFEIAYDDEFVKHACRVSEKFWEQNVLGKVAPEPDGSESYKGFLDRQYSQPESVQLLPPPDGMESVARAYKEASTAKSQAEASRELLAQTLKKMVGDAAGFEAPWGKVTWLKTTGQVDYKRLCKDQGIASETIEKYRAQSRTLRVTLTDQGGNDAEG